MSHDLPVLFGTAVVYLSLLFLIAHATDRGMIPERLVRHPAIYVLSLGVYATSWSYYGSVGFADEQGYMFLTIYLGVTLAFLLAPVLLLPLLRLTREYQLTSLADVFAFRFRSQFAGIFVTLFMLVGTLPYIALQIRAVTESVRVLTQEATPQFLALGFCVTLILFAILFGARHTSPREKHRGLVVAIAFESLVKLLALLSVGLFALFGVFSGPAGLEGWLDSHPEALDAMYRPVNEGPWSTLLLLSFAAAFLLPRQFHMGFTENLDERSLSTASWGFPLFLLLLNLSIPPILWGGKALGLGIDPDYYPLGITLSAGPSWLPIVAFIGGVSAASAMVIVTTLALSSMSLNHLLLPASYPDPEVDLYRWLLWGRRLLIAFIIMAGYGFYLLLQTKSGLVELGLISFVAVAQFLPGIVGVIYWHRANRLGFIFGLAGGVLVWAFTLLVPLLEQSGILQSGFSVDDLVRASGLDIWVFSTFWSLTANGVLFVTVSLLTAQSEGEREAAQACCSETLAPPSGTVAAASAAEFNHQLAQILGRETAEREVRQALLDLGLRDSENRPSELRQLRDRIERNLSGLIGPQLAHVVVNKRLALDTHARTALADSMRYIEQRLEESRSRLRGVSADLDALRRYHRQILLDLPLGVCAVTPQQDVILWNLAMEVMSGLPRDRAMGCALDDLPAPWGSLLGGFERAEDQHIHRLETEVDGRRRCFNLHKAAVLDPVGSKRGRSRNRPGMVMLLEDLTNLDTLEAELAHSERLAYVGRLAAGVAHEIGNPVTAIASLAQNMREDDQTPSTREGVESILTQTRRISVILRSLMQLSHSGVMGTQWSSFALRALVEEAMNLVRLTHSGKQVECVNGCAEDLSFVGDRQRLLQVMINILTNACDASRPGDRVEVLSIQDRNHLRLEVLDQGEGIAANNREYVFEPFFTTKPPGEGTGLGLPLVRQIVQEHHGDIEIDSAPGKGTRVVIRFPRRRLRNDVDTEK